MYAAHVKRKTVERLNSIKDAMIAGVWGNSNYDPQEEGKEAARKEILARIDDQFAEAIDAVYSDKEPTARSEDDIDWTDPFFAAVKSPRIRTEDAITGEPGSFPRDPDPEADREMKRMMSALDQL